MNPVTDPVLLAQLNGPVTDPAILAQLNGGDAPPIGPEIASGVTDAIKSAGSSVADYLNPFSDARHASYAKQAEAPLGEALTENLKQIGATGAALATPLTAPGNVASAVATPLVAHPFQALNKAVGVDLPYDQAKDQASTALMGIAPKGFSPVGARPILAPLPDAAALKTAATDVWSDPGIKSIQIPPQDVSNLSAKITNDLTQQGFRPTPANAPGTFAELDRLTPGPGVQSVGVDDIRSARRALGISAAQKDAFGKATPDANAATQAIGHIDSFLDNVSPKLREANANYAAGKQSETVDYRQIMADRRAAKTGSGSNIENTMRQEADKIPNRGLSPEEQALRDQIVTGTTARNAARKIGKLGFGDGLSTMYHAGMTLPTGGMNLPVGLAATAVRKVGESLTRSQLNQLNEMIRSRAPLSQARPMVAPQISNSQRIAALLAGRGNAPAFSSVVPSYAGQNQ